jgi:hypothetical protein
MTEENPMLHGLDASYPSQREPVRFVVISSPAGVREVIHQLHVLRVRDATTWSPLLPMPEPGMVMSINTHYRSTR